jgi:hypothetical protein
MIDNATAAQIVPPPNEAPIIWTATGTAGAAGTGLTGETIGGWTLDINPSDYVGDNSSNPSVWLSSIGGAGGSGTDGGSPTGNGGAGGGSGTITLNINNTGSPSGVSSGSTAAAAVLLQSNGGNGGTAGEMSSSTGYPGTPGSGGNGNNITVNQSGDIFSTNGWNGTTPGTTAILMTANGGNAAEPLPNDGAQNGGKVVGANGGTGGASGSIVYNFSQGTVASAGSAIVALSQGGTGGDGTGSYSYIGIGQGGNGGQGGDPGSVQMTIGQGASTPNIAAVGASAAATGAVIPIDASGDPAQAALMAAGIQAQSMGGAGGVGGTGDGTTGKAGKGGDGGNASTVNIALNSANISTTGFAAAGVLAQSVGGAGGNGQGAGGIFFKKGGNGAQGGDAGAVTVSLGNSSNTVWPSDLISTTGDDSMGVVAQSIGGGGGAGGAVAGGSFITGVAIGGNGQTGGTGAVVSLDNGTLALGSDPAQAGFVIATQGENSSGLVAQSIGGGGGTGGSASGVDGGAVSYTVGGTGGSGGAAGTVGTTQVSEQNLGIVSTTGNHAKGMVAQAVGGGGDGGGAQSLTASAQLNVSVAVGGDGGTGGTAGDVTATNAGQIFTSGSDAWGVLAQSVAGGGGNGGSSVSEAFLLAGNSVVPSVVINASVGGKGGDGSASGNIYAYNDGLIMTAGPGAHGILAQSISGGGGNGGDSSALTAGASAGSGTSLNVTVSIGGSGGDSGAGGNVAVDNSAGAMIWTTGEGSDGIFAQSVSGGGGSGGTAKITNDYLSSGQAATLGMSLGGHGGGGATGGTVNVSNEGNVLTLGDGSNGILAQSVGGGGGVGSGGSIKGSAAKASGSMTVTGNNGEGGSGGAVNVTNSGTVLTYGGDAAAIYAQSVGGGGGRLGTGTTAGLSTSDLPLGDYLASSKQLAGRTGTYGGVTAFDGSGWQPSSIWQMENWAQEYLGYAAANTNTPADGSGGTASVNLYLGGSASGTSNGGDGGNVTVTNAFTAQTNGPASAGVFAQSVGAGGGQIGEYVVDQIKTPASNTAQLSINFNGQAISYGDGGAVTVNNTGNIVTAGDASFGVLAQSIGGGGGESIVTASQYASGTGAPIQIALSDSINNTGNGGAVNVSNASGSLNASIATAGNDAVGIVAQSIGGGGGDAVVMQTTKTSSGTSMGATDPTLDETGSLNAVTVGTWTDQTQHEQGCDVIKDNPVYNSCGNGGAVTVSTSAGSSITTAGRNAHGVLAQSFGGGGGWIVGLSEGTNNPFNSPAMAGSAGDINLALGGTISTGKDGAYGVLAQSVGGGGVLGGDLAFATSTTAFPQDDPKKPNNRVGSGGTVTINNTGTIVTSGDNATGIFAQSVGGGGGLYAAASLGANGVTSTLWMGTSGGTGDSGPVNITNSGTVQVTGTGSSAVVVDTQGQSNSSQVSISNSGSIIGTSSAPAIMLMGGNGNGDGTVTNSGTISAINGTAVSASATSSSFAVVNNNAGASISGDANIGNSGAFNNNGTWETNGNSTVGTVNNNGLLIVGGANTANANAVTTLSGNLNNAGAIQSNVDFYNRSGNVLAVNGTLNFNGGSVFSIKPSSLMPNTPVEVIAGDNYGGSMSSIPVIDPGNNYLFKYSLSPDYENVLAVQANAGSHFQTTAVIAGAYGNPLAVARNLDTVWETVGSGMSQSQAQTYASLASISSATQYLNALTNLGNEGAQAASVAHVVASDAFVERMNSCPRFAEGAQDTREHDCVWGRVISNSGSVDASGDSVGYHQSGNVFQLGGQKEVASDWFVGGSVSADNSNLDTTAVSNSINGHGWTAGAVVKHQMSDWLVSAVLEGGEMSYDASRQVQLPGLGGTARSEFDVSHWGLHSRISRQFAFQGWYLKPYVDLHATHIQADGYTEQGAGPLDLNVSSSSTNVFGVSPMIEAGSNIVFNNGMSLQLYGGVGGTFYSQGALGADMQFADSPLGAGTFHISSDLPSDRLKTTAGLDLKAGDHWDMRLEYSGEFAEHFQSDTGALKVSYKF